MNELLYEKFFKKKIIRLADDVQTVSTIAMKLDENAVKCIEEDLLSI